MSDSADTYATTSDNLGDHLRRWIVLGGYILGGWATAQSSLLFKAWGLPFSRYFLAPSFVYAFRLGTACHLVAPVLLVVGCWGLQNRRRWARSVLLSYAGIWVGGLLVTQTIQFADLISRVPNGFTGSQLLGIALGSFDMFVYASVYAAALVLCLTRPEIRNHFPEIGSGFTPIIIGDRRDSVDGPSAEP